MCDWVMFKCVCIKDTGVQLKERASVCMRACVRVIEIVESGAEILLDFLRDASVLCTLITMHQE